MTDHELLVKIMQDNFKEIKENIKEIDKKLETLVNKSDCKEQRKKVIEACINHLNIKQAELKIKKIATIGTIVTGSVGASSLIIITLIKIFFN